MVTYKVGGIVWRGFRYWSTFADQVKGTPAGWNTKFIPYRIIEITPQRIKIEHQADTIAGTVKTAKDYKPLFLNRATMEAKGQQYHTRYHEYFYAAKPRRDPEHEYQYQPAPVRPPTKAMIVLNIASMPYSKDDVRRAYKRLAKTMHPDTGGSHQAFIELKEAHDSALRFATQ